MKFRASIVIAVLLTSCAAGPHPIPASAQAHLASAKMLPEVEIAIDCTPESLCVFAHGTWYPPELAAHMVGAEVCCADSIKELRGIDRPGVDTVTVVLSVIAGGIAAGLTVAAGYELRDYFKK